MHIERYTADKLQVWDKFVKESKNGTFLFLRDYMDYHAYDPVHNPTGKFHDHSLLYYNDKGQLLALMPANEDGNVLWSHQGLTYGGLVLSDRTRVEDVCEMFDVTRSYLRALRFTTWYYKQIPAIYHHVPSQEDEYALWLHNAQIVKCGVSSTIADGMPMSHDKRRAQNARKGYVLNSGDHFAEFWPILEHNLMSKYGARPVHTLDEILLLHSRFPHNIKCHLLLNAEGVIEAGAVLYLDENVAHTQYLSASPQGKQNRAMDHLIVELLELYQDRQAYKFLDLGTSTDSDGRSLQPGLISFKEAFGGRATVYKIYKLTINC